MLDKIKEIIIEQLNLQGVEITEETSFKDDLGADSLDLFELVMAFEEEFEPGESTVYRLEILFEDGRRTTPSNEVKVTVPKEKE